MLKALLVESLLLIGAVLCLCLAVLYRIVIFILRCTWKVACSCCRRNDFRDKSSIAELSFRGTQTSWAPASQTRPLFFSSFEPSAAGSRYPHDWYHRRRAVIERDEFRCQHCGGTVTYGSAEVHHLQRTRKDGVGDHAMAVLTTLCQRCHTEMPNHRWMRSKIELRLDGMGRLHLAGCRSGEKAGWHGQVFRDTVSRGSRSHSNAPLCPHCFRNKSPQEVDALLAA